MSLSGTLFDLTAKTALVTGASRGIGRAIAERLAQHGARVLVVSRQLDACESVAAAIRSRGGAAEAYACDLSQPQAVQKLADALASTPIDIVAANAAGVAHVGPLAKLKLEALDAMWNANLKGHLALLQRLLPGMVARRDGAIVLTGSISGLVGESKLGGYALTKAAEMQLARNIAVEYGPHNIRCNAVAPGLVRTDMTKPIWSNDALLARITAGYPLRRIAEPDDIAGVVVFLASAAGAFMTGQTIVVDGGGMAGLGTPV
jgi:NAD(P)-dependent dehydrogenase (short-subunit alcohol dehydrogenase family)